METLPASRALPAAENWRDDEQPARKNADKHNAPQRNPIDVHKRPTEVRIVAALVIGSDGFGSEAYLNSTIA